VDARQPLRRFGWTAGVHQRTSYAARGMAALGLVSPGDVGSFVTARSCALAVPFRPTVGVCNDVPNGAHLESHDAIELLTSNTKLVPGRTQTTFGAARVSTDRDRTSGPAGRRSGGVYQSSDCPIEGSCSATAIAPAQAKPTERNTGPLFLAARGDLASGTKRPAGRLAARRGSAFSVDW
jgi:hypothetical protein